MHIHFHSATLMHGTIDIKNYHGCYTNLYHKHHVIWLKYDVVIANKTTIVSTFQLIYCYMHMRVRYTLLKS